MSCGADDDDDDNDNDNDDDFCVKSPKADVTHYSLEAYCATL
jgi:hypothetical protein